MDRRRRWDLEILISKLIYKVVHDELKKKYPTENDWDKFSQEFVKTKTKENGEPDKYANSQSLDDYNSISRIYKDDDLSRNKTLSLFELRYNARIAELDLESVIKNIEDILHHYETYLHGDPNDCEDDCNIDLKKDSDRFKILVKAIEFLPIDKDLCEETKLEIKNHFNDYIEKLKTYMLNKIKEASDLFESTLEQLEEFFQDKSQWEEFKDNDNISGVKEDIETAVAPILHQLKRLDFSKECFTNSSVSIKKTQVIKTIPGEGDSLLENQEKSKPKKSKKSNVFYRMFRFCFCFCFKDKNEYALDNIIIA